MQKLWATMAATTERAFLSELLHEVPGRAEASRGCGACPQAAE